MYELLVSAQAGDRESIERITEIAYEVVRRVIAQKARYLAAWVSAEDVVQDSMLDLAKSFSKCRAADRNEFEAWVSTMARHELFNRRAKLGAVRRGSKETFVSGEWNCEGSTKLTPDHVAHVREVYGQVSEILKDGNDRMQTVMSMLSLGWTIPEIAASTSSTNKAVAGVVKRVRKKISDQAVSF